VQSLLVLLKGGNGGAVMMPAAACLRFLALAPGAADVMAGGPADALGRACGGGGVQRRCELLAVLGAAGCTWHQAQHMLWQGAMGAALACTRLGGGN
jgi:hypothetical protein